MKKVIFACDLCGWQMVEPWMMFQVEDGEAGERHLCQMCAERIRAAFPQTTKAEEPKEEKPAPTTRINPVDEHVVKEMPDRSLEAQQQLLEGETEDAKEEEVPPIPPVAIDADNNPLSFRVVERLPEFPGGMVEFMKWLTKNLKYPESARRQNMQGMVVVSFIVNTDGTTSEARIVRPKHPDLDREAMRVVRMMPKWKPGEDHGKVCRTMISIPIVFKL